MTDDADADFRALMEKITRDRGFRCLSYKDKCLRRRVGVRMRAKGTDSYREYAGILDTDQQEYDRLHRVLTINVTKFFRNRDAYAVLEQRVIPQLWDRSGTKLRVWSAGCATGEEAYSVAILMHAHARAAGALDRLDHVSIVGTDIDGHVVADAKSGLYPDGALGDTPDRLRADYFPAVGGLRAMLPEVKRMVTFQCADLLQAPPPFERAELILCRNVIIYFERDAQEALFREFHRVLAPGGFLVLGKVETLLGEIRSLFSPVNARERIFRKL
ncbi:MAG TPA: protein-glutamate O-methyltransferase CheR [Gemmatimonadaceae bacterium]|nr:protein-glutamate O-methyltransferase CheR [Gemmatimonadaceae bacterium]